MYATISPITYYIYTQFKFENTVPTVRMFQRCLQPKAASLIAIQAIRAIVAQTCLLFYISIYIHTLLMWLWLHVSTQTHMHSHLNRFSFAYKLCCRTLPQLKPHKPAFWTSKRIFWLKMKLNEMESVFSIQWPVIRWLFIYYACWCWSWLLWLNIWVELTWWCFFFLVI